MTPESKVKRIVRAWLKEHYPTAWVGAPVQMGYGRNNFLDFHIVVPVICAPHDAYFFGIAAAIETKAKGKDPTKRQERTMYELSRAGAVVEIVRDASDLDKFQARLNARIHTLCK